MANFFSAFPSKRLVRFALLLFCLLITFQLYFSLFLFRHTSRILGNIDENLGKIYVSGVGFDVVSGFSLSDVSVMDNSYPPRLLFQAKRLSFNFSPWDIFRKKLNFNRLVGKRVIVYTARDSETFNKLCIIAKAVYAEFFKHQMLPLEVGLKNPRVKLRDAKIMLIPLDGKQSAASDNPPDSEGIWFIKINADASLLQNNISSKGSFSLEHRFSPTSSFASLFKNELLSQTFDYEFLAHLQDDDFIVERFDLGLGYDHIVGQAILKNLDTDLPMLNLIVNSSNLSIENITSLAKGYKTRGTFSTSAVLKGPLNDLKFILTLNFLGCTFDSPRLPLLKNIVGKVHWTNRGIKIDDVFFISNDIAFRLESNIVSVKDITRVRADLSVENLEREVAFLPRSLSLNLGYRSLEDRIVGDAQVFFKSSDDNIYSLQLQDFKFLREQDSDLLLISKVIFSEQNDLEEKINEDKGLRFLNLSARFDVKGKEFKIRDIQTSAFKGKIWGDFILETSANSKYELRLYADNLNTAGIQDALGLPYNLLGDASAKLFCRSDQDAFCEGIVLIKDGSLRDTAILLGLSDYMNIDSLKVIGFDTMQLNFSFLKSGLYRYGLKSKGKDIILKANMHIKNDNQISGYFNAQLSHDIMDESPQFRRLLKIIRDVSAFVEFPFTLSGTIHRPRLHWLRNDFKRSLERVVPGWYRRGMQRNIDSAVEGMFEEEQ